MKDKPKPDPAAEAAAAHFGDDDGSDLPAWEQIDAGRYMPRRIRGSCRGRALG